MITEEYIKDLTAKVEESRQKKQLSKEHLIEAVEITMNDLRADAEHIANLDESIKSLDEILTTALWLIDNSNEFLQEDAVKREVMNKARSAVFVLLDDITEQEFNKKVLSDATVQKRILEDQQIKLAIDFLKDVLHNEDAVKDLKETIHWRVKKRQKPLSGATHVSRDYAITASDQVSEDLMYYMANNTITASTTTPTATLYTGSNKFTLTTGQQDPKTGAIMPAKFSPTTKDVMAVLRIKLYTQIPHKNYLTPKDRGNIDLHREVTLSAEEYASIRAISLQTARDQLETAYNELTNVSYQRLDGKKASTAIYQLFGAMGKPKTKDGRDRSYKSMTYIFKFEQDIATALATSNPTIACLPLLKIDHKKNPQSFLIGQRLVLHHTLNIKKHNCSSITIKSLLDYLPELPKAEETKEIKRKIKQPFIKDLQALIDYGVLEAVRYREGAKAEDNTVYLKPEQVIDLSYEDFIKIIIEFNFRSYPEGTVFDIYTKKAERAQARAERAEQDRQYRQNKAAIKKAEMEQKAKERDEQTASK